MPPQPQPLSPPTAQQVQAYLLRYTHTGPSPWMAWLPIIVIGAAVMLVLTLQSFWALVLPWLLLLGLMIVMATRVQRARSLQRDVRMVQELAMLRRWMSSLRLGWRLLPSLRTNPELHGRVVAYLAHNLDQLQAWDAALVVYDYLLDQMPGEHPAAVQLRTQRAIAQLMGDRLSDADEALRRLRGVVDRMAQSVTSASYRLAWLIQQVRTNHFADALDEAQDLVSDLRPLGVEAAYGHALLALSCHQLAQGPQPQRAPEAAHWWSQATLLLPPGDLVARFPELQPMTQYPSSYVWLNGPLCTATAGGNT